MQPYRVILKPLDRPHLTVYVNTCLDALCLVAWAGSPGEVYEYESKLDLGQHGTLLAYLETCKGLQSSDRGPVVGSKHKE
jgi:hypothetical protein